MTLSFGSVISFYYICIVIIKTNIMAIILIIVVIALIKGISFLEKTF